MDWRSEFKEREIVRSTIILEHNALLNKLLQSEERFFAEATSQSVYLKKVSSEMASMGMNVGNLYQTLASSSNVGNVDQIPDEDWREKSYAKIREMKSLYFDKVVQNIHDIMHELAEARIEDEVERLYKYQDFLRIVVRVLITKKEEVAANQTEDALGRFEESLIKFFSFREQLRLQRGFNLLTIQS